MLRGSFKDVSQIFLCRSAAVCSLSVAQGHESGVSADRVHGFGRFKARRRFAMEDAMRITVTIEDKRASVAIGRASRPLQLYTQGWGVSAPHTGFHFGRAGRFHTMRPYLVEYPHHAGAYRFAWQSLCGLWTLWLDEEGSCDAGDDVRPETPFSRRGPQCPRCQRKVNGTHAWTRRYG
jgi:hypothetical protein